MQHENYALGRLQRSTEASGDTFSHVKGWCGILPAKLFKLELGMVAIENKN